jgi:glycine cleavage system pyridoxal-binding protein P
MQKDSKKKNIIMDKLNKSQALQVIANVCQKYGCEIRRLDLERNILDIQGTEEAQEKCKQDLEILLK